MTSVLKPLTVVGQNSALQEEEATAPDLRGITDTAALRNRIYDGVLTAASTMPAVSNTRHTLRLGQLQYAGTGEYSPREQKAAVLEGRSLNRRLRGTWELVDNASGSVLDRKTATVATVPFVSDRGTLIFRGNEYILGSQMRLRPGIFTRIKDNGEIEAHGNILPGKGLSHRYFLDPASGLFKIKIEQANIPLMPLLRALGATDKQLVEAWGRDLFYANAQKDNPAALNKIYERLIRRADLTAPDATKRQLVREAIEKMEMDPEVNKRTLGKAYKNINLDSILDTTRKLIAVSRNEADVDDRDNLAFQTFVGPEEVFAERLLKDYGGLRKQLLRRASFTGNLRPVHTGALTKQLEAAILSSGLANTPEEINPLDILDKQTKLTRMGEGGLSSLDAVPDDSRSIQPSQFGFIDPGRTPECYDKDTQVFTSEGWKDWSDTNESTRFACLVNNRIVYKRATRLIKQHYAGRMIGAYNSMIDYLVTPNHRMFTCPHYGPPTKLWRFETAEQSLGKNRYLMTGGPIREYKDAPTHFTRLVVRRNESYETEYDGMVYCAEVPGGLLYVRRNNSTGFWCGNSLRAGVDSFLAAKVKKDKQGRIYAPFIDARTGKETWKTPQDVADLTIAFPGEYKRGTKRVAAIRKGKLSFYPLSEVDLVLPRFENAFSPLGNLVPLKSAMKAQRMAMASRMLTQALPLVKAEAPLVQAGMPDEADRSFEDFYGPVMGAVRAKQAGRVLAVSEDGIDVRYDDGSQATLPLYNNFPYSRKTQLSNTPVVAPGQQFAANDLLAKSNYTDNNGTVALGVNARIGYLPFRGLNFEDAIVVSESMAKRLESEHMYQHALDIGDKYKTKRNDYIALFPGTFTKETLATIDDNGVVKPGTVVNYGDPLILAARERDLSKHKVHKKRASAFSDASVLWEHHSPGVVTDVFQSATGMNVLVKSTDTLKEGDKLSGRYGEKGICSAIVPDEEMPRAADGKPLEILVSPLGLISRTNASQIVEAALGKIAAKTGKPYKVRDFEDIDDLVKYALDELAKHNMQDVTENVTDPETGLSIPDVLVGNRFFMKLQHQAESKGSGRATGGYSAEDKPTKGGVTGCFVGTQRIVTIHGWMPIATICEKQVGVQVLTFNEQLQEWVYRPVTDWFVRDVPTDDIISIEVNGPCLAGKGAHSYKKSAAHVISTTLGHEFCMFDGTRKLAGNLQPGDWLVTWGAEPITNKLVKQPLQVTQVRPFVPKRPTATVRVYDFTVDDTHTYCAGPALVSNSKAVGLLNNSALLSHGAYSVMRDVGAIRGQKNEEYWLPFLQGFTPPPPKVPLIYEKFVNQLRSAGINVLQQGPQTHIMAMTDKDIDELAGNRELTSGETVRFDKAMEPVKGGLFDTTLTGGHSGNNWTYFRLHEPMPSPVMEEPIRRLLGLTKEAYEDVLIGKRPLGQHGTGPAAVSKALSSLNLDTEIARARQQIASGRKTYRDAAVRKLGYLKMAQRLDLHPKDWILSKVPVLPPKFRPISKMADSDIPLVSDPNFLYKELFDANNNLAEMAKVSDDVTDERRTLYAAFKAVTGLGEPVSTKLREKRVKGVLRHVFGCYDEQTEILTTRGWLHFADLRPGLAVGTLNPLTNEFEWQVPTDIQKYRYKGELVQLKFGKRKTSTKYEGTRIDLLVTPNHRNWVRNRSVNLPDNDFDKGWEIEPAYVTAGRTGRQWFRTAADSWVGTYRRPAFVPKGAATAFAELVGWFVSEGWYGSKKHEVCIVQERIRNKQKCRFIQAVIDKLGFDFSCEDYQKTNKNGVTTRSKLWTIRSAGLRSWLLKNCGKYAHGKYLSAKIKNWPRELLRAFMAGYMLGDGGGAQLVVRTPDKKTHKNRNPLTDRYQRVYTTSRFLFDDLMEVACKLGLTLRLNRVREAHGNRKPLYIGNLGGHATTAHEGSEGKECVPYDGYVYCCTVPNGILFVRRNGVPVFSGNSSPKHSSVQARLLASTVDLVGRAVIAPDSNLDMDHVGLPEDRAWDVYRPFIVRRLRRRGMGMLQAMQAAEERTPLAKQEMLKEMEERPVIIDRAPVLHRFGMLAAFPVLTKGSTLRVSPLVVKGFGADFNGDSCRTPLLPVRIGSKLFLGDFETFIKEYVMPDYKERKAVEQLGKQTTILEFSKKSRVYVPGVSSDGRTGWKRVANISIHTSHGPDCYRVRTERGMSAVFTAHHNFIVCDDQCRLRPAKTTEVKPGTRVPLIFGLDTELRGVKAAGKPKLPLTLETGFFLGCWLGDGSLTGRKNSDGYYDTVSVSSSKDPELLQLLETIGEKFSDCRAWYEGNRRSVRWSDPKFSAWLTKQFGCGSDKLRIPGWCMAAPSVFREGLLAGYIVAEGNLQPGSLRCESTSRRLLLGIQMLCNSLGVASNISPGKKTRKSEKTGVCLSPTYVLRINRLTLALNHSLPDELGEKWQRLFKHERQASRQVWDMVPYPKGVAELINERSRSFVGAAGRWATVKGQRSSASKSGKFVSAKDRKISETRGFCTRAMAHKLTEQYDLRELPDETLQRWLVLVDNRNILWDEVVSVKKTKRPQVTYDFSVPDGETFCIDGFFVTHNTQQYHVPVDESAKEEAIDRMLPSRNLLSPADFKRPMHGPSQDYTGGLYEASTRKTGRRPGTFRSVRDVLAAFKRGELDIGDVVEVLT